MAVDIGGGNLSDGPSLRTLLDEARTAGVDRLDAELIVAAAAGVPRALLIADDGRRTTRDGAAQARARIARRAAGEPLAYIEGRKEFWSIALDVTPDVLVPRPETELLVETVLERLPPRPQRVADLGTGSGAIAIAVARERPQWQVLATDRSAAALAVARGNARRLDLTNLAFAEGAWFAALPPGAPFDALVSNPPYIAPDDDALPALRFEPRSALVSADHGLDDLRQLVTGAPEHLRHGGWLLLEHGADQESAVDALFDRTRWQQVQCRRDLAGLPRITIAAYAG